MSSSRRRTPPKTGRAPGRRSTDLEQERQLAQRRKDRRTLLIVAAALLLLVVGGGVGYQIWTNRDPGAVPARATALDPVPIADGEPVRLGDAAAPRTLTLYVDFHCHACIAFEEEFGPALFGAVDRGAVALEVFPMSFIDGGSVAAANGFACAAEAGFGTAYYRGLFANHDLMWSDEQLVTLGRLVSPQVPSSFDACVTTGAHAGWVDSITAAADRAGVESTPTILLDGDPVDWTTTTPEMLVAMIDEAPAR